MKALSLISHISTLIASVVILVGGVLMLIAIIDLLRFLGIF